MKRGCAARKDAGASLHASAASASQKPSGFCFTFAAGKRFIAVYETASTTIELQICDYKINNFFDFINYPTILSRSATAPLKRSL